MSRLLIMDGHAYAYRAFHAIRELRAPSGEPTNAIYGFIKMLQRIRTQLKPSHIAVVWDGGLCEVRMAELPEYKAQRAPMPTDLEKQLDGMTEYLKAAGIASFCEDKVEADDYIAWLAKRAVEADLEVVIASADKDFMQLVQPSVGLVNPNDKVERIWGAEEVLAKTGVQPAQIVDWLSLIGDAVDNIPGVPGVGLKTATDLIKQFGSIENLYLNLPAVKSDRLRGALQSAEVDVRRNQKLIRLNDRLSYEFSTTALVEQPVDAGHLRDCYLKWGFRTMLAELDMIHATQGELLKN